MRQHDGGGEGQPGLASESDRWPLSYPTDSRQAPFLSPLTRGEDGERLIHPRKPFVAATSTSSVSALLITTP